MTSSTAAVEEEKSSKGGSTPLPPGSRPLGTQENLFAPRQYLLNEGKPFPPLAHICSVTLDARDGQAVGGDDLRAALAWAIGRHPLLSRRIVGSGHPSGYLDDLTMRMVRADDPDPLTFAPMEGVTAEEVADMVLSVDDSVEAGGLEDAWRGAFAKDLDEKTFNLERGPLWSVQLLREKQQQQQPGSGSSGKCVLVFSFNHAIDD